MAPPPAQQQVVRQQARHADAAPEEDTPLGEKVRQILLVLLFGAGYITLSWGLITFNKHLMTPGHFPFASGLGLLHSMTSSVLAFLIFLAVPSWFPALSASGSPMKAFKDVASAAVPIAICFTTQITLSNQAYLYADVAFLQMLKESNIVAVYFFSILFSLEVFRWRQFTLVLLIISATWMTVQGEPHITVAGVALQGSSFFAESMKITLQGLLLSSAGKKIDPLSYMLSVMPFCAVFFGGVLLTVTYAFPDQTFMPAPTRADWLRHPGILAINSLLAFALNLVTFCFIRYSSALTFVLTGIIKDVCIVVCGIVLQGHETTSLQTVGFTLQVGLIVVWSMLKVFPKEFEHGVFTGFLILLTEGARKSSWEPTQQTKSLLKDKPDIVEGGDNYGTAEKTSANSSQEV